MQSWIRFVFGIVPLIFCLTCASSLHAMGSEDNALVLSPAMTTTTLAGHLTMLRDPSGALSIEDVAYGEKADGFVPVRANLALGYTTDAVWLKVVLERSGAWPRSLTLSLLPLYLDRVDVFVPRVGQPALSSGFDHFSRGDHIALPRSNLFQLSFDVPLDLPHQDTATIYLRIKTSSTMALKAWLTTQQDVGEAMLRAFAAISLVTLTFAVAVLSLGYSITVRRRYFLTLSGLLLADCLYVLSTSGIVILPNLSNGLVPNDLLVSSSVLLMNLGNIVFIRLLLESRRRHARLDRVLKFAIVVTALSIMGIPFGLYQIVTGPIQIMTASLSVVFVYYRLFHAKRYPKPGAKAATLVGIVKATSGLTALAWAVGIIGSAGFVEYAYWTAVAVFTPLLAISLIQRARWLDRRRRMRDDLRLARKAERTALALVDQRTIELAAARDIAETALKVERDLQAEQLRFVDVVRHQYQTPLSVIRTSVAAISQSLSDGDNANEERIRRVNAAIKDLVQVIDISLHRGRLDNAAITVSRRYIDLRKVLAGIVENLRSLHLERQIDFVSTETGAPHFASVDTDMLAIALANLVENAIKFSPPVTRVKVCCHLSDQQLSITVLDEGIGIPDQESENIGKRYFRASNADSIVGTGLGLHMVMAVARAHKGSFKIEKRELRGTAATLVIGTV